MNEDKKNSQDEFEIMFQKMDQYHEEFQKRLDKLFANSGFTLQSFLAYLKNPANFSKKEWEAMQKKRSEHEEKLWKLLGEKEKKKEQKKVLATEDKKRKAKTLGARKKWLQM